ncbi:MAG: protein kinase, partial [Candidatus Eremiobacterota bacterium]
MSDAAGTSEERIGNYRLIREIGRGSMGTVYLAHQESLARDLAIKVLPPEFTRDPEFVQRFQREARIAGNLRHPNIVRVIDFAQDPVQGLYYIVMEYLAGTDLREILQSGTPLGVSRSTAVMSQILDALAHAHAHGVVHRDVKPANVVVGPDDQVTLTDFSIAHIKDSTKLTQTGMMVGTPEYMSPEQFEGLGVDARSDLYACGVLLYEMLTGVQPFRGQTTPEVMKAHLFKRPPSPREVNPEVGEALGAVVMKALEKDADDRWSSAMEMRQAMQEAAQGERAGDALEKFLAAVVSGRVSMDEAIAAHSKMKEAIDQGFRKVLTVMMVDLAGSSKLKTPNQTFHADRAFRHYRAAINEALEGHGCLSYDWSGDGAICLFEDAPSAVKAAVQIQLSIGEVASTHQLTSPLLARIGINTGDVYLDPRRSLGEFASRTVDQAGHLEKDCPPGSIHVSQATAEKAFQVARYEEVGVNRDGVNVFRVVLPEAEPAPLPQVEPPEAATRRFCGQCGAQIPADARFCAGCGRSVEPTFPGPGTPPPVEPVTARPSGSLAPQPPAPSGSLGHAPQPPASGSLGHGPQPVVPPRPSGSLGHGPPVQPVSSFGSHGPGSPVPSPP